MCTKAAYRHSTGQPYVDPDNDLSYIGNFLSMLNRRVEPRYKPDPVLERALDGIVHPACGPRAELQHERHA